MPMEHGRQASSGPRSPSPRVHVAPDGGRAPQRGSPSQTTGFQPGACPLLRRPDHRRYQVTAPNVTT
jgi:hypothetical protein